MGHWWSNLSKIRLLLAIVVAAAAYAQPSIYPQQVKIGAVAGSTTPVSDVATLVSSGTIGANLSFTTSVRYLGTQQGWLSVSPASGTTPAQLTITADPTNLPAGTYSAQVVASVGPSQSGAWTNVTFTVAPSGSAPGGVAASPSTLTFSASALNSQTVTVLNAPGTTGTVAFSVFANPSNWLTFTLSGTTTPAVITVLPVAGNLPAGTYTASLTIVATATGAATVVPVTLYVAQTSAPTITLTPAQRALTFNFQLTTTVNPFQTVYVSTASTISTNFTASTATSWIGLAANSFDTPSSSILSFAPGLIFVTVDPTGLTAGQYQGSISLTAPGASSGSIPVTLNVSAGPVLNGAPSFLAMDTSTSLLSSALSVTASTSLFFTATVSAPWLSITPSSGAASANPVVLTATANPIGLAAGVYSATVTLAGSGGTPVETIPVQFVVTSTASTTSPLAVSPTTLTFSAISGATQLPQFVLVTRGSTVVPYTASAASDAGWLSISPLSGATPMLTAVSASTSLPAGLYQGSILFTAPQTGEQVSVAVSYTVTGRTLSAAPGALSFTQQAVGAALAPQNVTITADAPSTFQIASQPRWANVTATALTTPATLTVSIDPTGLSPGTYQDNIVLSGPSSLAISVALTVAAPPPPTVTPSSLGFSYVLGSPAPDPQTLQITNGTGAVGFLAAASTVSGTNWLTVTPASGTTPGSVTVGVAVGQLVPGQQSGSIMVTLAYGASFTVPVTLTVTGSVIGVQSIWNAAALAPASLSPGELVTLTGYGLGPDAGVTARTTPAGAYPTTLAGTTVTFDGIAAPLLYVQGQQINAIVPYEVYGRAASQVQVQVGSNYSVPIDAKVVDAAPGIFTSGGTGQGQAAALNADSTLNTTLNPAQRGTAIVLYLTGEGQTNPPGQDGRVIATDLRTPLLPVTATIGGQPAKVLYAGSAPSLVSGICQVNVQIPATLNPGAQPVQVQVGGVSSQDGVTIVVK